MIAALLLAGLSLGSQDTSPWRQYATPEEAGFSAERLGAAWEHAERAGSAAVFVVFRGHVLAAWGEVERRYECHSVRKSLVHVLVGLAVARGGLALDDTLAELGVDDLSPLTETEKQATLADLLGSRSGVYHTAAKEPADMRAERPARGSHAPGTHFFYNNWDFNLLGVLYERAAGTSVAAGFLAEIAQPLAMEDFRPQDVCAQLAPSYSRYPAHAFRMSARDLARFGELYRLRGRWGEREIVPASWVELGTTPHAEFDDGRGYGHLWWTYRAGSLASYPALAPHDCFAAQGTGGQFLLVVPGAELVLVHRGDTDRERPVGGRDVWAVAERVLAARTDPPRDAPELVPVQVERFATRLPVRPDHVPVEVDPAAFAGLTGEYDYDGFSVRVFVHADHLFAHRSDGEEVELLPLSPTRYFLFTGAEEIEFVLDESGRTVSARLHGPRGTLEGARAKDE